MVGLWEQSSVASTEHMMAVWRADVTVDKMVIQQAVH